MLLPHDQGSVEVIGDLLVVRLVGPLDLTTSRCIYASFERLIAEQKDGLALFELSAAGSP